MLNFQSGPQIQRVNPQQYGLYEQVPRGMPGGTQQQVGALLTGSDICNHASQTQNAAQSQHQVHKTGTKS
jgi:hypothetical protein